YLWSGDPAYWAKKSPILFPIVGTLKNNTYYYKDKPYHLTRHGFARDMEFELTSQTSSSLTFTLRSSTETLEKFPFVFRLDVIYSIEGSTLSTEYKVFNPSDDNIYFSIGGHPAFRIPLSENTDYEDYYFEFEHEENTLRWMISPEGLINPSAVPIMTHTNILPITRELFMKDAVVMKYLNSDKVRLRSDKTEYGIEFSFPRFPFLGLWTGKNGNFVCIEPWCGIADSTTTNQQFINKEGINLLTPGEVFDRKWSVKVY
ncbi:MAG: aldose 1-epimerase family protein, partial [Chitinophagaceae bacterium]|nr:aldose 1-epimerase family protein [Chitinophagaceae bacterium]